MNLKNESGITLMVLIITVIVLAILATVAIQEFGDIIEEVNKETISTDMLLIQAKAKVLNEKSNFNDDASILKGQKLSEITGNSEIENLKSNGVINTSDSNYDKYYVWNKQIIDELGIRVEEMEDTDFYIVNYSTEEVIYPKGYEHSDGNKYYKLSDISTLE